MALIYIVEDDENIREIETMALKNSNYIVQSFSNGQSLFEAMDKIIPDLMLLDIMLPDMDGYEICRIIRSNNKTRNIPIIMVSAKTQEMDMVKGLDGGADDYIKKPFSVMELLSRVKSLLRRTQQNKDVEEITVNKIYLNNLQHIVLVDNQQIELTYKEYELLRLLMNNVGIVLSRESIMDKVWDEDFQGESRTVDMHVKTLRQKLGDCGGLIRTIRNVGYIMDKEIKE